MKFNVVFSSLLSMIKKDKLENKTATYKQEVINTN